MLLTIVALEGRHLLHFFDLVENNPKFRDVEVVCEGVLRKKTEVEKLRVKDPKRHFNKGKGCGHVSLP
ncbi:unnamed protein product [Leptosia nina]|uniref:Uncharacterized protein n=1 Tax=Leptosia nina TaxID=320188 RepID=A0AAV1IUY3_9NEOP